jgi:hypothetical protein
MAIFTAIGSAIAGALFAGSALAATVISSGLAFAANLAISYLRRPKKRKYAAVQGETQYGGDVPVGALFGTGKTKGQRIFYAKWGSGNKINAEVFVLANGWNDGLEPYVYFFGKKHNLVVLPVIGDEAAHYGVEGFANDEDQYYLSFRFYDGRPGQGVDQKLVDDTAALGQTWKATSVNAGLCYVIVQRVYDGDLFRNGKPDIEFVLRGLREYDPRKDSTVAGGSGPQRINDPSTWTHQLNPAVHRLNYQLGLKALISGRTLIGEGKSLGQLDLGTYFVAMNVCDTLRTDGKKTYQCSLWVTGDDDHTEILKEFDDAMAGYGINRRGLSGVIPGAPQIPVMEITADDIPADRAKEIQYRKSAFERYNYLSGQFLSIELMWNPDSLKPVYVNAHVSEDGRPRQTSNDFLQVTDPDIAQYLLYIRYRQNRMGGTATLPVSRRVGLKVQEGEWVTWRGGTWMISEWVLDEQFRVTLKLSETSAAIYDDDDIEPGPVIITPTPPVNPSLLSTVQNFQVSAGVITNSSGADVPALRFSWTPPADPTITAVRFFYRPNDDGSELFEDQCAAPETGVYTTTKNVVSGEVYVARATITTVPDRLRTYTTWAVSNNPTGSLIADVLDNSIIADKIADGAVTAEKIMDGAVNNLKLLDGSLTITKFANGIEPVGIIDGAALPTTKTTETIYFQNKLYTWNSTSNQYETPQVGIGEVADGSITAQKLADAAVTAAKLAALAVNHETIAAGAIFGDKIAANSITARELVLTDFTNIYPDFDFREMSLYSSPDGAVFDETGTANGDRGQYALRIHPNASTRTVNAPMIPMQANRDYYAEISLNMGTTVVGAGTVEVLLELYAVSATGVPTLNRTLTVATRTDSAATTRAGISFTTTNERASRFVFRRLGNASDSIGYFGGPMLRYKNNANLIVDGAINANHLSANSVTAGAIAAGAITAGKIAAGAVSAAEIAAGAITATKMVISDFYNLASNPSFLNGEVDWTWPTGWQWVSSGGFAGGPYMHIGTTAAAGFSHNSNQFPVRAGERIQLTAVARALTGTTATASIRFRVIAVDSAGNWISPVMTNVTFSITDGVGDTATSYVEKSGEYLVPAGAVYAFVTIQNLTAASGATWRVGRVEVRRKGTGQLIVDGSITGDNIAANTIGALQIAANAITAKTLLLTDFTNLIQNWDFADITADTMTAIWDFSHPYLGTGSQATACFRVTGGASNVNSGQYALIADQVTPGSASMYMTTKNFIPVIGGEILTAEAQIETGGTAATAGFYFRCYWYDAAFVLLAANNSDDFPGMSNAAVPTSYGTPKRGKLTVPSGAKFVKFRIYHNSTDTVARYFFFDRLSVRRANGAELIVDGSITADMLTVNSLTAITANLGNASVTGVISSTNGKMVLDFNNGTIIINS